MEGGEREGWFAEWKDGRMEGRIGARMKGRMGATKGGRGRGARKEFQGQYM